MDARELRIWRMDHKLTLEEVAKHLGKHRNTVWKWENGAARLPITLKADLKRVEATLSLPAETPVTVRKVLGHIARQSLWYPGEWTTDSDQWVPRPPPGEWSRRGLPVEDWNALPEAKQRQWREQWPDE